MGVCPLPDTERKAFLVVLLSIFGRKLSGRGIIDSGRGCFRECGCIGSACRNRSKRMMSRNVILVKIKGCAIFKLEDATKTAVNGCVKDIDELCRG